MSTQKLTAIIIDDLARNIASLKHTLIDACPEVMVVASCQNHQEAIKLINELKPDIVFMPVLKVAGFLNNFEKVFFKIIFTTGFGEPAILAFRYGAFDFLMTPTEPGELKEAVSKVMLSPRQENSPVTSGINSNSNLALPTLGGFSFIDINKIVYCKGEGVYTTFFLEDKSKILVSKCLNKTTEMLEIHNFFRIHQSFLINFKFIQQYNKYDRTVTMGNGESLPIGRSKKDEFLEFITRLKL